MAESSKPASGGRIVDFSANEDMLLSRVAHPLRRARPRDAEALAPMLIGVWQGRGMKPPWPDGVSLRAIGKSIGEGKGRFRWQNNIIWEETGRISGVACAYPGEEEGSLLQALYPYLEGEGADVSQVTFPVETGPGEYYLDTLYVSGEARGKGVGSDLLRGCMMQTAFRETPLVLNVDRRNQRALTLYRRLGFVTFDSRILSGRVYDTMRYTPAQARREFSAVLE